MTISDYCEVHALWLATPGLGLNAADDALEGIEKYLERNPNTCFVAIINKKIVGVILAGHDGRRGFIYHMSVSLESRRQGIGEQLLNAALDALRDEGILKVALVTLANNKIGNQFWEKQGFTSRDDLIYRNKALIQFENIYT
ncbi:MAG: GNAT family N-acetyltransferase [Clostridiaceae bacterium]|nr:GNAT family N-acetyltransferase [Clostridiaceae bacterium]